jgi:hypothetical protein
MISGLNWCVDDGVWKDILCMAMYNGVYVGISFENLTMDVALRVTAYCAVDWRAIRNQIFANI